MPAQQRIGCDDRGDLAQRATTHPERSRCESPPVLIGQVPSLPIQLAPKEAVLFDQVGERLPLSAVPPAGQDQQQRLEDRGVGHEPEVISRQAAF